MFADFDNDGDADAFLSGLRRQQSSAPEQITSQPAGRTIVLNNSGYNYAPSPGAQRRPAAGGRRTGAP